MSAKVAATLPLVRDANMKKSVSRHRERKVFFTGDQPEVNAKGLFSNTFLCSDVRIRRDKFCLIRRLELSSFAFAIVSNEPPDRARTDLLSCARDCQFLILQRRERHPETSLTANSHNLPKVVD
jgi:hypothetical protein